MIKLPSKRIKELKAAEQSIWGHPVSDISGHEFNADDKIFLTPDNKVVTGDEAAEDLCSKFEKIEDEDEIENARGWCRANYKTGFNTLLRLPAYKAVQNGKTVYTLDCEDWPELTFEEYGEKFGYKEVDAADLFEKFEDVKTVVHDAKVVNYQHYKGDRYTPEETYFEVIDDFSGEAVEPNGLWENPEGKVGLEEEVFDDFKKTYLKELKGEEREEAFKALGEEGEGAAVIYKFDFTPKNGERILDYAYDAEDLFYDYADIVGYKEIDEGQLLDDYLANEWLEERG